MNQLPIELLSMIVNRTAIEDLYELSKTNTVFHYLCNQRVCDLEVLSVSNQQERLKKNYDLFYQSYDNRIGNDNMNPYTLHECGSVDLDVIEDGWLSDDRWFNALLLSK
jgi:hypothetical protein